MKKIIYRMVPIFLSLILVFGSSMTAFAEPQWTGIQDYNKMTKVEKWGYTAVNILTLVSDAFGVFISQANGGSASIRDAWVNALIEQKRIDTAEDMGDYIDSHLTYNDDTQELYMDATLTDDLHDALKDYLDANTGWYYVTTCTPSDISETSFSTKDEYTRAVNYIKSLPSGQGVGFLSMSGVNINSEWKSGMSVSDTFKVTDYGYVGSMSSDGILSFNRYKEWTLDNPSATYIVSDIGLQMQSADYWRDSWSGFSGFKSVKPTETTWASKCKRCIFTCNKQTVKVFKSLDDLKTFDVGKQPYYTTSKWNNYVSGSGNTITQQEFNAPVTYENIVNNIVNNTTITNGISEEQLQQIIDAIIEAMKNNGGGGSGGGNGDGDNSGGGSSGGGLAALLAGLGKLGDAILSIVGKLIEYIGKALELVSSSILSIIDVIPKSYSQLITAMFPFFPEEWVTAITLSLVLAVLAGIVGIFKK